MKIQIGSNINKIIKHWPKLFLAFLFPLQILGQQTPVFLSFEKQVETAIETNNYKVNLSSLKAKTGNSSVFLDKNKEFGPSLSFYSLPKIWVKASVWKYGKGGGIVCSIADNNFYRLENNIVKTENDWQKIEAYFLVPKTTPKQEIKVYLHNNQHSSIYFDDFSIEFLDRYPYPSFTSLPVLDIVITENHQQKLDRFKSESLINGRITSSSKRYFKSIGKSDSSTFNLSYRIKGDWLDHLRNDKWSYRIKLRDSISSFQNIKTFSVQSPNTRSFLREWLLHKVLEEEDVLTTQYDFIEFKINGDSKGIYAFEGHFDKYLLERQGRREAPILKFNESGHWQTVHIHQSPGTIIAQKNYLLETANISVFKKNKTAKDSLLKLQFNKASDIISEIRFLSPATVHLIDKEKFAKFFALTDVFQSYHSMNWINLRFYLNPLTGKIEPVVYDGYTDYAPVKWNSTPIIGYIDSAHDTIYNLPQAIFGHFFTDSVFTKNYYDYLAKYSSLDFLDGVFDKYDNDIKLLENALKKEFTNYQFKNEDYYKQADFIRSILSYAPINLIQPKDTFTYVSMWNWMEKNPLKSMAVIDTFHFSLTALKMQYINDSLYIINCNPKEVVIESYINSSGDTIDLDSPLFIKKYNPNNPDPPIVLNLENVKYMNYLFNGRRYKNKVKKKSKIPYRVDVTSQEVKYLAYFKLVENVLVPRQKILEINSPITLPVNYSLNLTAGTQLKLSKNGSLIIQGDFIAEGTKENQVFITGENLNNGILVNSSNTSVSLNYVNVKGLGAVSTFNITTTGGITIYNATCAIRNCIFENSRGEDMLNIVNSTSTITNTIFRNAYSDALDIDYGNGKMLACTFEGAINDNIDVSGATYTIENTLSGNAKDKAISCGENSKITIVDSRIYNSDSGIVVKDKSEVNVKNTTIENCGVAVKVFQKKVEYGGAKLTLSKTTFKNNKENQFKDEQSIIIAN